MRCARALGLTPPALSRLVAEGALPKASYGKFDPIATTAAYIEHLAAGQDDNALAEERVGLLRARRLMAEHELMVAQRYLDETMLKLARTFVVVARTAFMDIAGRLAPRLAIAATPQACFALVDSEGRQVLTKLSEYDEWDSATHLPRVVEDDHDEETRGRRWVPQ
jgi:hypothetical protein